ncbi:Tll0287-like domain-containing protein [Kordiimonas marina]|uniref:Tll0287-like domain-containing protein n=1 Tax=Kordiimonas marina TaxID=2872312 RepID=UPI001FF3DD71|nr:DUF3365 domain-containing protein [Kordiimonas marina]MCJ9427861.1 DUF3365 domain-containing protein [Kordiimonas marina]
MKMTPLLSGCILWLGLMPAASAAPSDETVAQDRARALDAIQVFQKSLKSELMKAMAKGGPAAAVTVCNEKAPGIAEALAHEKGLRIGRTSLKLRNPNNAPDMWEKSVLEDFEHKRANGDPIAMLEAALVKGQTYRFMKAIPTQGLCTVCHGAAVNPKLYKTIKALYPEDKAVGFRAGDIRGAFTVTIPLEEKPAQD